MNLWKMIGLASILLDWLGKASADGKIDAAELLEVLERAIDYLGIDVDLELPEGGPLGVPPQLRDG